MKRKQKKKVTFTKILVSVILFVSLLDVQLVFILAFLGRMQIAESMGICICTEIIATILGYLCKSFFENREIGKNELEEKKASIDYYNLVQKDKDFTAINLDDAVG